MIGHHVGAPRHSVRAHGGATLGTEIIPVGQNPIDLISGQLDGDNILDLAVVNDDGQDNLRILKGNGDGTFAVNGTYTVGDRPEAVVAADFDLDGDLDLATANRGSGNVAVLLNNGTGGFTSAGSYAMGGTPHDLVAGLRPATGDNLLFGICWNNKPFTANHYSGVSIVAGASHDRVSLIRPTG